MVVVPHKLQVAKHGARALRLLLVKAEMLPATLVVVEAVAGTEVDYIVILLVVDQVMSILLPLLQIILLDVY